jgi:hypothetical protein
MAVEWRWSTSRSARTQRAARLSSRQPRAPWPREQAARRGCSSGDTVPAAREGEETALRAQHGLAKVAASSAWTVVERWGRNAAVAELGQPSMEDAAASSACKRPRARESEAESLGSISGFVKPDREQQGRASGRWAWSRAWPTHPGRASPTAALRRTPSGQ